MYLEGRYLDTNFELMQFCDLSKKTAGINNVDFGEMEKNRVFGIFLKGRLIGGFVEESISPEKTIPSLDITDAKKILNSMGYNHHNSVFTKSAFIYNRKSQPWFVGIYLTWHALKCAKYNSKKNIICSIYEPKLLSKYYSVRGKVIHTTLSNREDRSEEYVIRMDNRYLLNMLHAIPWTLKQILKQMKFKEETKESVRILEKDRFVS